MFAPLLLLGGAALSAWYAGYRLPGVDEGAVLTQAAKLLRGAVFYRDVEAYPFPGAPYLLALGFELFGEHLSVSRGLAAGLYCGLLLALYRIALLLLCPARAALYALSLLSFKFLAWPQLTGYFYSDVALAFACAAIALLLGAEPPGGRGRRLAAGALLGAAILCKQNLGLYASAAALALLAAPDALLGAPRLGWRRRADAALWLAAGAALLLIPCAAYFASHGVLGNMLSAGLVRPLVAYAPTSGVSLLEPLAWWRLGGLRGASAFPYFAEPYWTLLRHGWLPGASLEPLYWIAGELASRLTYTALVGAAIAVPLVWLRARRRRTSWSDWRIHGFAWLCLALLLSALPRADFAHLIEVAPVALLLMFAWSERLASSLSPRLRRAGRRAELAAVAALLALTGALSLLHHARLTHRVELDRASVAVAPSDAWTESVVRFVEEEVGRGDLFFVYGNEAQLYFLTARFYPWRFTQLYPGQVGGDGGWQLAELLRQAPPVLVYRGVTGAFAGLPALRSYAPHLDAEIRASFVPDARAFQRHPPPQGLEPPASIARLLRRR